MQFGKDWRAAEAKETDLPLGYGYGTQGPGRTWRSIVSNPASSPVDVLEMLNGVLKNARDGGYGFNTCVGLVETAGAEGLVFAGTGLPRGRRKTHSPPPSARRRAAQCCNRCPGRCTADGWPIRVPRILTANCAAWRPASAGKHTHCAPHKAPKDELPANVREVVNRQAVGPADSRTKSATLRNEARPTN